ncbi:hypothetical protein SDC9_61383 [bioreactor metagenome]|uniref:Uncharacterized protein n=1 Tax=bioreactor metagenome TaxID=1076179 RepID=A0A644XGX2_9ZZZZ
MKKSIKLNLAILTLTIAIALLCSACAPANTVALADTPEPTPSATATPAPTPSPTPEPTPTLMPELTFEQKRLLLGIDNTLPIQTSCMQLVDFSFNNQEIRFCTVVYDNHNADLMKDGYGVLDFYSVFDQKNGYLFTVSIPIDYNTGGGTVFLHQYLDYIVEINPALEGMKPLIIRNIASIAYFYDLRGIDYNDNETLKKWSDIYVSMDDSEIDKLGETFIPIDELVNIFLDATDQEKILPFWKYVPGAQVPDELKEFYPNETLLPEGSLTPIPYVVPAD